MKLKKLLVLGLALACIATISITATLAYFTDDTETVVNTFTVGKVVIDLDEAPVDEYGVEVEGGRTTENTYKLIPSHTYTKDPTVLVAEDSEPCFLFVTIDNQIANIEDDKDTIVMNMEEYGWLPVEGYEGLYCYCSLDEKLPVAVDPKSDNTDEEEIETRVTVFDHFTIAGNPTNKEMAEYEGKQIIVNAYAIQAAGFNPVEDSMGKIWVASGFELDTPDVDEGGSEDA